MAPKKATTTTAAPPAPTPNTAPDDEDFVLTPNETRYLLAIFQNRTNELEFDAQDAATDLGLTNAKTVANAWRDLTRKLAGATIPSKSASNKGKKPASAALATPVVVVQSIEEDPAAVGSKQKRAKARAIGTKGKGKARGGTASGQASGQTTHNTTAIGKLGISSKSVTEGPAAVAGTRKRKRTRKARGDESSEEPVPEGLESVDDDQWAAEVAQVDAAREKKRGGKKIKTEEE